MSTSVATVRDGRKSPAGDAPGAEAGAPTRLAAIDIGSNSVRMLIADVSSGGIIRVVDELKAAPRLGAGVSATGALGHAAMTSAVEALGRMATLARQMGATRIDVVATSAVRDASNRDVFVGLVRRATGLEIRVLEGNEEAELAFRSALAHFELGSGRAVVLDIGGGSLEIALSADGLIERLASLPLGAVRLTEEFLADGDRRRRVRKLRKATRAALKGIPMRAWRGARVIGSGGTFTNLAGMYLARQSAVTAQTVHATTMPRVEVEHILDMLEDLSPAERLEIPGLNAGRADIIVAGIAVAAEVLARLDARTLTVSRYGIREGLLLKAADITPTIADPGEARERSLLEFAMRCHYDAPHAHHVRELALSLFDAVGDRLDCEPGDRQLLADAALLHDVGYHINYEKHHKHSYHLILHAAFLGVSPTEQVVIANVARYHRGAAPKKTHRNFGMLDKPTRQRIRRLAALLRVADGLDRGHVGAVGRIKVRWLVRAVRITPVPRTSRHALRLELWAATRKAGLLADLADRPVEIVGTDGRVTPSGEVPGEESAVHLVAD